MLGGRPYDKSSVDSQFTDVEEELTLLDACVDCDDESLYEIPVTATASQRRSHVSKIGGVHLAYSQATTVIAA